MKPILPFLIAESLLAAAFITALFVDGKMTISEVASTDNIVWFCIAVSCIISCMWLLARPERPSMYAVILAFVILSAVITIRPNKDSLDIHAGLVLLGVLMVIVSLMYRSMYVMAALISVLLVVAVVAKAIEKDNIALILEYPLFGVLLYGLFLN
jgi:hypothetical protein